MKMFLECSVLNIRLMEDITPILGGHKLHKLHKLNGLS